MGEANAKEINEGLASTTDFTLAKWRWIIDLCGFDREQYGLTGPLLAAFHPYCSNKLQQAHSGKLSAPKLLADYFTFIQQICLYESQEKPDGLSSNDALVISQLAAYFENPTPSNMTFIIRGFTAFKATHGDTLSLAYKGYLDNLTSDAPTYLPAILKTAQGEFKKLGYDHDTALEKATTYTLTVLEQVFTTLADNPGTRISARNAAWYQNWQNSRLGPKILMLEHCALPSKMVMSSPLTPLHRA